MWRENHVLDDFMERQEVLMALASKINTERVLVRESSATDLSELPDSSVDYVFTDPPFGSNLFYADCSMLWESWLGQYTDERFEMVVSDRRLGGPFKTLDDYAKMMTAAIREMYRVLKPGRWATVEFNNSDGKVFEAIKRAVYEAGFQIANMLLLDKTQKSFKQTKGVTSGEDVVDKDVLFNLHKPASVRTVGRAEDHDLE
jgi:DNA modification methylase